MLETVKKSLHHSCRSELTRQGISLPLDRQSYSRRLLELSFNAYAFSHHLYSTGQVSVFILLLSNLQRPVFLLNSRFLFFNYNKKRFTLVCHSFSRSYRANLPSSFSILFLIALVCFTYSPVSVYSTVFYG